MARFAWMTTGFPFGAAVAVVAGLGSARVANAATTQVTCSGLQAAINAADAGDTIQITDNCSGGYPIELSKNLLTLEGANDGGPAEFVADGGDIGLRIAGSNNTVKKLMLSGFSRAGIEVWGQSNTIGVDGGTPADRVAVSNTGASGDDNNPCRGVAICVVGPDAGYNTVTGCSLQSNSIGIQVIGGAFATTVAGNQVIGSAAYGILVSQGENPLFAYTGLNSVVGNLVQQSGVFGIGFIGASSSALNRDSALKNTVQCTTGAMPGTYSRYSLDGLAPLLQLGKISGTGVIVANGGAGFPTNYVTVGAANAGNLVRWNAGYGVLNLLAWDTRYEANSIVENQKAGFADLLSGARMSLPSLYLYLNTPANRSMPLPGGGFPSVSDNTIERNGVALPSGSIAACFDAGPQGNVCGFTQYSEGGWEGDRDGVFLLGSWAILTGNKIRENANTGLSAHVDYGLFWVDFTGQDAGLASGGAEIIWSPRFTTDDTKSFPTLGDSDAGDAGRNVFENNRSGGVYLLDCRAQPPPADSWNDIRRPNCGNAAYSQVFYGAVEVIHDVGGGVGSGNFETIDAGVVWIRIRSESDAAPDDFAADAGLSFSEAPLAVGLTPKYRGIWGPTGVKYNDVRTWYKITQYKYLGDDAGSVVIYSQPSLASHIVEVRTDAGLWGSTTFSFDGDRNTEPGLPRLLSPQVIDENANDYFQIASVTVSQSGGGTGPVPEINFLPPNLPSYVRIIAGQSASELSVICSATGGAFGIASYMLDWGDGTPRVPCAPTLGQTPVKHIYMTAGRKTLTLTVLDAIGQSASKTATVDVLAVVNGTPVYPPTVRIIASATEGALSDGGAGTFTVTFGAAAQPGQGATSIDAYSWDFGDGQTSTETNPTHTYTQAGSYRVRLQVTDNNGITSSAMELISITLDGKRPPTVQAFADKVAGDGPINIKFSYVANVPVSTPTWTFSDDNSIAPETAESPTQQFPTPGIYTVRVTVTDPTTGLQGRDSVEVVVTKNGATPPKIVSVGSATAAVGQPYAYDSDRKIAVRGTQPFQFVVGKIRDGTTVNNPAGFSVDPTGLVLWTPTPDQGGDRQHLVTVRVTGVDTSDPAFTASKDWQITVSGGASMRSTKPGCSCALSEPQGVASAVVLSVLLVATLVSARIERSRRRRKTT